MPKYNGNLGVPYTDIRVGEQVALFAAETLAAPATSIVIARSENPGGNGSGITFTVNFATSPTAAVEIWGSNVTPTSAGPQGGFSLYTSTNKLADSYTDINFFAFYWVTLDSQSAGGALTVLAQR